MKDLNRQQIVKMLYGIWATPNHNGNYLITCHINCCQGIYDKSGNKLHGSLKLHPSEALKAIQAAPCYANIED